MHDFSYQHLRYFHAVAHEGNLTRAAEHLRVAQSAVSSQIKRLEQALGHALFERRGRDLVLTEAGRIALDHADRIFAVGDELVGTLLERERDRVVLRVGSMATLSRNFQLRFLQPLFGRSDVELVVRSGTFAELLPALEAHRIDVLLANAAPSRDAATPWVVHEIAEQPVSLVGATDVVDAPLPLSSAAVERVLAGQPLVLPSVETGIRTGFDAYVARLGIRPHIAAEVDDMAMLRLLARERVGVAVVPSIVVRDELAGGDLVELAQLPGLVEHFYAITLTRRFPNPLLRELLSA